MQVGTRVSQYGVASSASAQHRPANQASWRQHAGENTTEQYLVRKQGFQDLQGSGSAASSWEGDGSAASCGEAKASRNCGGEGSAAYLWGSSASNLRGSGSAASSWGSSASRNYGGICGATSSWGSSASRICPVYNNQIFLCIGCKDGLLPGIEGTVDAAAPTWQGLCLSGYLLR